VTGTVSGLSALAEDLRLDGHLDECGREETDWRHCSWCLWAVSIPEIDLVLGLRQDGRALLAWPAEATVAWVVAADELLGRVGTLDLSGVLVPSVRRLAHRLLLLASADLEALDRRLGSAVAAAGPVERRCLHTATAVMVSAIRRPENADLLGRLPERLRIDLLELSGALSSAVQVGGLLPTLEDRHWQGLPALRTQPAWGRRPGTDPRSGTRSRQAAGAGLAPGSLEALVMESVIDQVIAGASGIEGDLVGAAPPIPHRRPVHDPPHTAATRSLLWRVARIDWHLTFVDSGRAGCWNTRVEDGAVVTDVPWPVAVAIEAAADHGFVSATHQERPTVEGFSAR